MIGHAAANLKRFSKVDLQMFRGHYEIRSRARWFCKLLRTYMRRSMIFARGPRLKYRDLMNTLTTMAPSSADVIFVHSSLSALGYIRGGAQTVLSSLRDWSNGKTLCLTTHSYCYPNERGQCETFDVHETPSRVGAISDLFWRQPGVLRSVHPTHSLAAYGPNAEKLIRGHESCSTPCGKGTPYERLVQEDSGVLMFGATMNTYTLFHTAEDAAMAPYLYEKHLYILKIASKDDHACNHSMHRHDMGVQRRFEEKKHWLEEQKLLFRYPLGAGELLWIPSASAVHNAVVAEIENAPGFLLADAA